MHPGNPVHPVILVGHHRPLGDMLIGDEQCPLLITTQSEGGTVRPGGPALPAELAVRAVARAFVGGRRADAEGVGVLLLLGAARRGRERREVVSVLAQTERGVRAIRSNGNRALGPPRQGKAEEGHDQTRTKNRLHWTYPFNPLGFEARFPLPSYPPGSGAMTGATAFGPARERLRSRRSSLSRRRSYRGGLRRNSVRT